MKILYAVMVRMPTEKAHGTQIVKTIVALAQAGVTVELQIPDRKNTITTDIFEYYQADRVFQVTKIPVYDFVSKKLFGIFGFWLQSFLFTWKVIKNAHAFNALYTRDFPVALRSLQSKKPLIYEIHSLPKKPSFLHKYVWNRSAGIIVISDGLREELIAAGVDAEKITVVRDSVDIEQFQNVPSKDVCRATLQIPIKQKTVVYTGHLYGWKGADTLALATSALASDIHVYIVGGTDEDIARFREKFRAPNLHIVGRRPHQEMPLWLASSDVLVIPNSAKEAIGAKYTSPLKLFEYMAANRPIVATDVPALREVLLDKAAWATPDDAVSLAKVIGTVFINYQEHITLAQYLADTVVQYSWSNRGVMIKNFIASKIWK